MTYLGRLSAHLNRFKRINAVVVASRDAIVTLTFTIDKQGRVVSYELTRPSTVQSVNDEALALFKRADPLPPIPTSLNREQWTMTIPVKVGR